MKGMRTTLGPVAVAVLIGATAFGVATVAFARQVRPAAGDGHPRPGATPTSPAAAPAAVAPCSSQGMKVSIEGAEGAAGTIRTVWRAQNVSGKPCRSFGYPAMDVRGPNGWLGVQAQHGGYPDIDRAPKRIVVAPGHSLFFPSYWSDVTTDEGSCMEFDLVRVTLPGDAGSSVLTATGCLTSDSVRVGPVTAKAA